MFTRQCQSCGYRQVAKPPSDYKNDSWRDLKCKNCKNVDLDYGSEGWLIDDSTKKFYREELLEDDE